jgi:hypothetical protein
MNKRKHGLLMPIYEIFLRGFLLKQLPYHTLRTRMQIVCFRQSIMISGPHGRNRSCIKRGVIPMVRRLSRASSDWAWAPLTVTPLFFPQCVRARRRWHSEEQTENRTFRPTEVHVTVATRTRFGVCLETLHLKLLPRFF